MRLLAHNGEINTLLGNIKWIKSRLYATHDSDNVANFETQTLNGPLVDVGRSDSANLDRYDHILLPLLFLLYDLVCWKILSALDFLLKRL